MIFRVDEFKHRIAERKRVLTVVEPPRHFIQVGRKMLCTDLVPPSSDAALEQRECVLNRIGVNFAPRIAGIVIDDAMLSGSARGDYFVGRMRVRL